jgi:hypothetical protein
MQAHPHLAATYAQMGRDQDAQGERVVILHLSPFFDARTFARNSARKRRATICSKG